MLPVYLILPTSQKHAVIYYGKPSTRVWGGERREERENEGNLVLLCAFFACESQRFAPRVGAMK